MVMKALSFFVRGISYTQWKKQPYVTIKLNTQDIKTDVEHIQDVEKLRF